MHADRRGENPGSEAKGLITVRAAARVSATFLQCFPEPRFPQGIVNRVMSQLSMQ